MSDTDLTEDDVKELFVSGAMVTGQAYARGEARGFWDLWLAAHDADTREQCAREIEKWRDNNLHHVPQPADDLAGYYMRSGTIDGLDLAARLIREGGQK